MWFNGFCTGLEICPAPWRYPLLDLGLGSLALAGSVLAVGSPAGAGAALALLIVLLVMTWRRRRRRVLAARLSPAGGWLLRAADGRWRQARLEAGWLAAGAAGLSWRDRHGRRWQLWLWAADCAPRDWRRLRAGLRLPRRDGMT